jgi:type III pantothenate kinase
VRRAISTCFGAEVDRIEGAGDYGIRLDVETPAEVGPDRIANAVGAFYEYGGPCIVVDLGTATTFDVITAEGEYTGGAIAPGIAAGAVDLRMRARMLPAVEVRRPGRVVGKTTVGCMQSGIFFGAAGQVEGIVRRIWDETGLECRVIITGGHGDLISGELGFDARYDPYLTLKGIAYAIDGSLRTGAGHARAGE